MTWWQRRSAGEKQGLTAAFVLLLAVALFLLLEPLVDERRRLSAELPRLREDLAWMEARVGMARELGAPVKNDEQPGISPARVEALLQEADMRQQVSGMQPLAGQGMLVSFNEVDFADLLVFISRLRVEGHARVAGTQVNGMGEDNGLVSAELKLLPR